MNNIIKIINNMIGGEPNKKKIQPISQGNNKNGIIVVGVVIFVLIILVIIVLVFKNNKQTTTNLETSGNRITPAVSSDPSGNRITPVVSSDPSGNRMTSTVSSDPSGNRITPAPAPSRDPSGSSVTPPAPAPVPAPSRDPSGSSVTPPAPPPAPTIISFDGSCRTEDDKYPPWKPVENISYDECKNLCFFDNRCSSFSYSKDPNNKKCQLIDYSTYTRVGTAIPYTPITQGSSVQIEKDTWKCYVEPDDTSIANPTYNGTCLAENDKVPPSKLITNKTYNQCKNLCEEDTTCSAYAYDKNDKVCVLFNYSYSTETGTAPFGTSIIKGDESPEWKCYERNQDTLFTPTFNGSCRTSDDKYPKWKNVNYVSYGDCRDLCLEDTTCTGYSYRKNSPNQERCQLFNVSYGDSNSGTTTTTTLTKGNTEIDKWGCYTRPENLEGIIGTELLRSTDTPTYNGACRTADNKYPQWLSMPSISYRQCKKMCIEDSRCQAYAYSTDGKGNCQLFDMSYAPANGTAAVGNTSITKGDDSTSFKCYTKYS